jgi:hypothetical protein
MNSHKTALLCLAAAAVVSACNAGNSLPTTSTDASTTTTTTDPTRTLTEVDWYRCGWQGSESMTLCLTADGVHRFVVDGGTSSPSNYTSYVQSLTLARNNAIDQEATEFFRTKAIHALKYEGWLSSIEKAASEKTCMELMGGRPSVSWFSSREATQIGWECPAPAMAG